jgi:hypothetical protein
MDVIEYGSDEKIKEFFAENGYVAVSYVYSANECARTIAEVEGLVHPEFKIADPTTHHLMPFGNRFAVLSNTPLFSRQMVLNRINPRLLHLFGLLFGHEDFLVTHDSGCLYRPTVNHPEYRTPEDWPHLDLHPDGWKECKTVTLKRDQLTYANVSDFMTENNLICETDGLQLAAVANFIDNRQEDGGFFTLPGFHKTFDQWVQTRPTGAKVEVGLYKFDKTIKNDAKAVGAHEWKRVAVPAGAVIIWDQRMAHGSRPNRTDRPRLAQFIKAIPSKTICNKRLKARSNALHKLIDPLRLQLDHKSAAQLGL